MRTVLPNAARRDTVVPTLQKAQETLTDTVLPAVRDALVIARERGTELIDNDVTHEARRRGVAVVKAARGDLVIPTPRPWKWGIGMLAFGAGLGVAATWLARRLATPIDSYTSTMPVASGTDGGVQTGATDGRFTGAGGTANGVATGPGTGTGTGGTTGAAPAGTPNERIDLRSGAPTKI